MLVIASGGPQEQRRDGIGASNNERGKRESSEGKAGSCGGFEFFEVFGEESGNVFEFRDVVGIDWHQRLMGFQTGACEFFTRGCAGRRRESLGGAGQFKR